MPDIEKCRGRLQANRRDHLLDADLVRRRRRQLQRLDRRLAAPLAADRDRRARQVRDDVDHAEAQEVGCDLADLQGNPFPGVGRNTLRANGWDKLDASIFKTFKIHENYGVQLQFSAYNVLNKRLLGTNDPELDDTGTFWNSDYNYGTSARQVQMGARITF